MRRAAAFILLAALAAAGCGRDERPVSPPVVVVSIDTLRSDRLPSYGYARGSTSAIDAFARESILFERAFAEVPLTLPSHASIFTGRIPPRHGVRDNLGFRLEAAGGATLAERLREAGYSTFGAVSSAALAGTTGISRGFERWDEPPAAAAERPGGAALAAIAAELARAETRPRLLFAHFYEPHAPYRPPEPFRSRLADPYDGEIAAADALFGELLAALRARGLYDDAIVVLLSDHGEGLGDHGEAEHGLLLYREALQVPLLVKLPHGERAGERVRTNVALVDLLPTILDRLRLPVSPADVLDGVPLLAVPPPAERTLYAETFYPLVHFGWSELVSAISGDLHLISGRRDELFDLAADPGERADRLADERRPAAALRRFLDGIDRTLAPPSQSDAETLAKLGALGYLGSATLPADRADLPDPRDRVGELAARLAALRERQEPGSEATLTAQAALRLLELGRDRAALELLEPAAAKYAGDAALRVLLSRAYQKSGRLADARHAVEAAIALDPRLADAWYQRAVLALAANDGGRPEDALPDLERAAALDARHLGARKALAMLLYAAGDLPGARARLEEVLALAPDDPDARDGIALIERRPKG